MIIIMYRTWRKFLQDNFYSFQSKKKVNYRHSLSLKWILINLVKQS